MADNDINFSSQSDLIIQLEEAREALQNLRFQKSMQHLEDLSQIKKMKKKIARMKTVIFQQKMSPLGSHWAPKIHKNRETWLPRAHFLPLLILVWKCDNFLTPWNLASGALAQTKHLFSLFHPIPKMS